LHISQLFCTSIAVSLYEILYYRLAVNYAYFKLANLYAHECWEFTKNESRNTVCKLRESICVLVMEIYSNTGIKYGI